MKNHLAHCRLLFLLPPTAGVIALALAPSIAQPEKYHAFADHRMLIGVPDFWNVTSNLPFAVVGILGFRAFHDLATRFLFLGILLTTFGSAYYHLAPDTPRLVWDRLPMTIAFMSLLTLVVSDCLTRAGNWLLFPLIAIGLLSVFWWRVTGDLRLYILVQFVPILMILVALLVYELPAKRELWIALLLYALAKIAEFFDAQIYSVFLLSGHTAKHLLAGFSTYWIYRWRLGHSNLGPDPVPPSLVTV
jgi:Ceramidase